MHPVRPSLALVVALAACAEVAPFVPAPPSAGIVCRLRRPALGTRSTRCEMARATRVNAELAGVLLVTDEVSGMQVKPLPLHVPRLAMRTSCMPFHDVGL